MTSSAPSSRARALDIRYPWPLTRVEADAAAAGQDDAAGAARSQALQALAAATPAPTPPTRAYRAMAAAEVARRLRLTGLRPAG